MVARTTLVECHYLMSHVMGICFKINPPAPSYLSSEPVAQEHEESGLRCLAVVTWRIKDAEDEDGAPDWVSELLSGHQRRPREDRLERVEA